LPIAFGWSRVARLGPLPRQFPTPTLPSVPWELWNELVMAALAIFVLASIESLLSASVVAAMEKKSRVDNDQELIGQGLGNLTSALFGGLPVTGVIARSATNIQAGARTRLAAILHAMLLLAMMFGLGPLVAHIPRAALAGVLVAVALRMIEVHLLCTLWRTSRAEAAVFLVTTGAIITTDLIVGVPVGLAGAFVYVVYEMSRLDLRPVPVWRAEPAEAGDEVHCPAVSIMRVEGPLFFASGFHLRNLVQRLDHIRCLVLDLSRVPFLDVTGAEVLEEAVTLLRGRGIAVLLAGPPGPVARRLRHLSRAALPALRDCLIFADLHDAMRHAATEVSPDHLCRSCRDRDQCIGLTKALEHVESLPQPPVPHGRSEAVNLSSDS
ncbi:MAG: SulP family inorganic anion transporter, partial [Isosphaeraceae bacterium]|nr:SulP family inorganic anion transporter [Isosphaeraceae bacterium]